MADITHTGCIVQVWFDVATEIQGRAFFNVIETDCPDFASFCELVEDDRLIGGAILWTTQIADGQQRIDSRVPVAFRGSAVMRCQLPRWSFCEADD